LKKIDEWIGEENWDIIQFNWGLWDLCYRFSDSKVQGNRDKENGKITYTIDEYSANLDSKVQGNRDKENGKITYTIDEYSANLDSIVTMLQSKTEARLIFVTTTYVPENEAGRYNSDAIKYNDAAKKIMKKHSIIVNDIYDQSIPIHPGRFSKWHGNHTIK